MGRSVVYEFPYTTNFSAIWDILLYTVQCNRPLISMCRNSMVLCLKSWSSHHFEEKVRKTDHFQKIRLAYNDCFSLFPVVEQNMKEGSSMKKKLSPQTVVEASSNALSDMEISTLVYIIAHWVRD